MIEKKIEKVLFTYQAKDKIKLFIGKYPNSIYNYDLENLQEALENQNKSIISNQIRAFIKNYGNIIVKGDIGEALYELIEIFQEIDKNNEEEEAK